MCPGNRGVGGASEHLQPALSLLLLGSKVRPEPAAVLANLRPWEQRLRCHSCRPRGCDPAPLLRFPTEPPAECRRRTRSFVFPPTEGRGLVSVVCDPARRYLSIIRGPSAAPPPPVAGRREITLTLSHPADRASGSGRVQLWVLGLECSQKACRWRAASGSVVVIVGSLSKCRRLSPRCYCWLLTQSLDDYYDCRRAKSSDQRQQEVAVAAPTPQ